MYILERKDVVATLEVIKSLSTGKQILVLRFDGKTIATFDEGQQLRSLNPENVGEWRQCSCCEKK